MATVQTPVALDDLASVSDKAELIDETIIERSGNPTTPQTLVQGQIAGAEPHLPSWCADVSRNLG
jgi:hypothetical protein